MTLVILLIVGLTFVNVLTHLGTLHHSQALDRG